MKISNEVLENLANVFFFIYKTDEEKQKAMSILKIFDFEYVYGVLCNNLNNKIYRTPYKLDETKETAINDWIMKGAKGSFFEITPYEINTFDRECIEDILNQNKSIAESLSPLLDALGWVVKLEGDTYRIHFIGGPHYDVWKETDPSWDEDFDLDNLNWKDIEDGIKLPIGLPNWKEN